MHSNGLVRTDRSSDGSARAVFRFAEFPSIREHNPALVRWGELRVDPDLAGLAIDRARPTTVEFADSEHDDTWELPVSGVLDTGLSWHPNQPMVAGLASDVGGVHLWIANYRTRTVELHQGVRAATSLTSLGGTRTPLAWIDESLLAVVTVPGEVPTGPEEPRLRPTVYEAAGPGFVAFEPNIDELAGLASAVVSVLDLEHGTLKALTPRLLVRGVAVSERKVVVEYLDEAATRGVTPAEFGWSAILVGLDGRSRRAPVPEAMLTSSRAGVRPPVRATDGDAPERIVEIPTGWDNARLWVWDDSQEHGVRPLWLRVRRPGADPPVTRFDTLAGCAGATLDFPMHWPADASLPMLRTQIVRAVQGSIEELADAGGVAIGGHSFGATIALYALANVSGLTGGIAHSGCYNRTLTPTGFQWEKRSYWQVPEIYQEFSALLFADRIEQPVLIVHGTDDTNPATSPEHAVQLYRGIVAAGGHARLVLLPYEGHNVRYRENREVLFGEHRSWLCRLGNLGEPVAEGM